ncbi:MULTISPECIES: enoyl-CoA hydratase/isomerase family protein [unclassified Kitasatospora]|uniref:enoyl-CoA hydratase/isomerase family protein n=1 Tax=unclassified Kitasatospora TaxID=2633591 RepID=UPI00070E8C03|nr:MULTISPECIES: enoyl-CoA hydratase/isomerase family protein [unclassified Kitasatospora]KQV04496.1 3-hydroxyisobutyryl-CoA hydrolase [Kitasatospora sp. Root107]KRB60973.1 3-hydroxyisobutyryl-CoA hydrolase [Kitasatospora sp. Root187]
MTTDVVLEQVGRLGRITLDRPRALNALTHGMLLAIEAQLTVWATDDSVAAVLLTGAGERGLCAGADIRALHDDAKLGGADARQFFRDEYRLNHLISRYPKPYVAVMDGITMGGGVGLSAHGGVRVVTERSTVAMPETRIGLMPDVGGSRLLAHAPGELGTHLGLTAAAMGPGDALLCGFADHFVPVAALADFTAALTGSAPAEALARYATEAPEAALGGEREWIDACYAADTVEEILARLDAAGITAAKEAAEQIRAKSPTSLKVTLAALRRARTHRTLAETLDQEFRISCAALDAPDLVEGIRAQVVDKDRNPHWSPATLAEVTDRQVAAFFADLGDRELGLSR